jgi:carbon monoxide dehydrogenase subunit G
VKLRHNVSIAAPPDLVWDYVADLPRVAACVPGVEQVESVGGDRYSGLLKISLGPIRLKLAGHIAVTQRDESARMATLHASGSDAGAGGAVEADVRMAVRPGATRDTAILDIDTDAQVMGRIGEFGQPLIKRKADQTMSEFAANLSRAIAAPGASRS